MSKETNLAVQEKTAIQTVPLIDEQTLKDFLLWSGTKLSDEQFKLFMWVSKSSNLNPFKREIYPIPFERSVKNAKWQWEKKTDISIVSWYQVYLDRASATGLLDWWKVELTKSGAKITIYRKDFKFPIEWEVEKVEFQKTDKDGNLQWSWKIMPNFMIKKVAIGQWFRLAFPSEMWGLPYLQEEISSYQEWIIEEVKTPKDNIPESIDIEETQNLNFWKYYDSLMTVLKIEDVDKITEELKKDIKNDGFFISKSQLKELWSLISDIRKTLESNGTELEDMKKEVVKKPEEKVIKPPVQTQWTKTPEEKARMLQLYRDIFTTSTRFDELAKFQATIYYDRKVYWFSEEEVNELLDICKAKRQELNEIYGDKEEKLQTPEMQIEEPGESL